MSYKQSRSLRSEPGSVNSEGKATGTLARAGWRPNLNVMYNPWNGNDYSWMTRPEDVYELPAKDQEFVTGQSWWLKWCFPKQRWYKYGKHWGTDCSVCGNYIRGVNWEDHESKCEARAATKVVRCQDCKTEHEEGDCVIFTEEFQIRCDEWCRKNRKRSVTNSAWRAIVAEMVTERTARSANVDTPVQFEKKIEDMLPVKTKIEPIKPVEKTCFDLSTDEPIASKANYTIQELKERYRQWKASEVLYPTKHQVESECQEVGSEKDSVASERDDGQPPSKTMSEESETPSVKQSDQEDFSVGETTNDLEILVERTVGNLGAVCARSDEKRAVYCVEQNTQTEKKVTRTSEQDHINRGKRRRNKRLLFPDNDKGVQTLSESRLRRQQFIKSKEVTEAHGIFKSKHRKIKDLLQKRFAEIRESFIQKFNESQQSDSNVDQPSEASTAVDECERIEFEYDESYISDILPFDDIKNYVERTRSSISSLLDGVAGVQDALGYMGEIVKGLDISNPIDTMKRSRRTYKKLEISLSRATRKLSTPIVVGSLIGMLVSPFAGSLGLAAGVGVGMLGEYLKRTETGRKFANRVTRLITVTDEIKRMTRALVWIAVAFGLAMWSGATKSMSPLLFGIPAGLLADFSLAHGSEMAGLSVAVLYHFVKRFLPRSGYHEVERFLKDCKDIGLENPVKGTLFECCQRTVMWFCETFKTVVEWVNKQSWFSGRLEPVVEKVDDYLTNVENLTLLGPKGRLDRFFENSDKCLKGLKGFKTEDGKNGCRVAVGSVNACLAEGIEILRMLQRVGRDVGLQNGVKEVILNLNKVKREITTRNQMTTDRVEPTVVWIAGPAGTGKTSFAQMLMKELVKRDNKFKKRCLARFDPTGLEETDEELSPVMRLVDDIEESEVRRSLKQEIWTKSGTDKFWTGYNGQRCISWEEAAVESISSELDGKNTPSHQEFLTDFLQLVSQADFRPQMAAVEDKGTAVNPDFVVVTSNILDVWTSGDREAIRRRQHIPVLAFKTGEFRSDMRHLELYIPKRIKCTSVDERTARHALVGDDPELRIKIDCGFKEIERSREDWMCPACHIRSDKMWKDRLPRCEGCLIQLQKLKCTEEWRRVSPAELADLAWAMYQARLVIRAQNKEIDLFKSEDETPSEKQAVGEFREILKAHSLVSSGEDARGARAADFIRVSTSGLNNDCFFYAFKHATGSSVSTADLRHQAQRVGEALGFDNDITGYDNGCPVTISGAYAFCHDQNFSLSVYIPETDSWYNDEEDFGDGRHLWLTLRGALGHGGHWECLKRVARTETTGVVKSLFTEIALKKSPAKDAILGLMKVLGMEIMPNQKLLWTRGDLENMSLTKLMEKIWHHKLGLVNAFVNPSTAPILANLYDLIYRKGLVDQSVCGTAEVIDALVGNDAFLTFCEDHEITEYTYALTKVEDSEPQIRVIKQAIEMEPDELLVCAKSSSSESGACTMYGLVAMSQGTYKDSDGWTKIKEWTRKNQMMIALGVVSAIGTLGLVGGLVYQMMKKKKHKNRAEHRISYHNGLDGARVVDPTIWAVRRDVEKRSEKTEIPFYKTVTQDGLESWRLGNEAHAVLPDMSRTVLEKIIASCGKIWYHGTTGSSMFCCQVHGSWFLCPAHLIPPPDRKRSQFPLRIEIRGMEYEGTVKRDDIRFPSDLNDVQCTDVMLICVRDVPMGPKITQYIDKDKVRKGDIGTTLSVLPGEPPILTLSKLRVIDSGKIVYRTGYELLEYPGFSCGVSTLGPGDCGTLFIKNNRICGMYVAGGLTRSDFIQLNTKLLWDLVEKTNARSEMSCEISEIGPVVDRCHSSTFHDVGRSRLVPSGISDSIIGRHPEQPLKVPAILDQEAFIKGLRKFSTTIYPSPDVSDCLEYISKRMGVKGLRSLHSWDEAVNGIQDGNRISKPVDLTTSAGLPWVDEGLSKCDLIIRDDGRLQVTSELARASEEYEERVKNGVVDSALCFAQLKDELRDRSRVAEKKTRIFIANPVHVNLVFRKYLLPFMFHYKRLRREAFHAIGVDPFSEQWKDIADKATGRQCLAVDFSRFDATHPRWLIVQCFEFIASMYEERKDQVMIKNLGECLVNFTYYHRGRAYMATGGQPSGSQVTTVLNSIINSCLWLKCWKTLGGDLKEFGSKCDLVTFGDDCIFFAEKEARIKMDPGLVAQVFERLGYTITAPDKSEILRYTQLCGVTFLGRSFAKGAGQTVLPRREVGLVWSSLCWEHEEASDLDIQGRIRAALAEIAIQDNWKELLEELKEHCLTEDHWARAWDRVPVLKVVEEFQRRVGIGGKLCPSSTFGGQDGGFEKATLTLWCGIPELDFV